MKFFQYAGKILEWKNKNCRFIKMYYIVITKKQRNVCYNFFESSYSFAHFKCKGYILYSKLLLQWPVRKKKFSRVPNLKKLYLKIFKYHIEEKKYVSIIFEVKRQKKCFVEKKILTVNLPWNDPYTLLTILWIVFLGRPDRFLLPFCPVSRYLLMAVWTEHKDIFNILAISR